MAKQRYTEIELESIARKAIDNSLGSPESDIGQIRQRNIDYYNAEPIGDLAKPEIEDRSDFVSTDVADTVEWMLPAFIDMFASSDDAVSFEARRVQDEPMAQMAQAYINHLYYVQNDGLSHMYDWFKDSLIQKVGFSKTWVEECAEDVTQKYEGQSEEMLVMLLQDGWELVGEPEVDDDDAEGGLSFTVTKRSKRKQIKNAVVPPYSMRVDSNARWDSEPAMIGEVMYKRRFELEQEGYVVDDANEETPESELEAIGLLGDSSYSQGTSPDRSHDLIKVEEVYIKLDQDMDGVAEWIKICLIGGKLAIYEYGEPAFEAVDGHPYTWICPVPRPHSFFGDCPADFAIQPQKLRTHTIRAIQDNMFLTVNQRTYVNTSAGVNVDDLLESRPGGVVRGDAPYSEAMQTIVQPNLGAPAYQFNEFLEGWKENRTGFTRYSQGTDANSLNKTATGVSIITQKSDMRVKLMARFFGVGMKALFAKMLKLSITHLNQEEIVQIAGQYVPINPSHFRNDFGMKIRVGLGTGSKEQQSARIMALMQVMQGGVAMGVVKPENIAEAIKLFAEANEFKEPERFVSAPDGQPSPEQIAQGQQALQMQQQQIEQMGGQMQQMAQENEQLKSQLQNKQVDTQIKAQDLQASYEIKAQELSLKERELALKERELEIREREAQAKALTEQYSAETARIGVMTPDIVPVDPFQGYMA
jgi:hypothetical protein